VNGAGKREGEKNELEMSTVHFIIKDE